MADVKEQIQRIVTLAKKHPYIAGGAVLGVVGLGYLAYKNGGGSGGSDGSATEDVSAGIDTSGTTNPLVGGGVSDVPVYSSPSPVYPSTQPDISNGSDGSGGGGGGSSPTKGMNEKTAASLPSANIPEIISVDDGPSITPKPKTVTVSQSVKKDTSVVKKSNVKNGGRQEAMNETPAQQHGKGRLFTGFIDGQYYILGYPSAGSIKREQYSNVKKSTILNGGRQEAMTKMKVVGQNKKENKKEKKKK